MRAAVVPGTSSLLDATESILWFQKIVRFDNLCETLVKNCQLPMKLNSSCRKGHYRDVLVIDSKIVLYLDRIMSMYWLSAFGKLAVPVTV